MRAPEKGVVGSAVVDAGQRSGPRTTRPARTACRQTPAQVRSPEPPACPVSRPSAPQRSQIPRKYITPYLSAIPPAGLENFGLGFYKDVAPTALGISRKGTEMLI